MILLQNIMENVNGFCFSLTLNDDYALPTWPKADFLGVLQFFIRSHCSQGSFEVCVLGKHFCLVKRVVKLKWTLNK